MNFIFDVRLFSVKNCIFPVDETIKRLSVYLEEGDCIIDGGMRSTERRKKKTVVETEFSKKSFLLPVTTVIVF